ncbi:MAG TPA: alpha-L-fucosidase [Spirochaetales bacterium]|nr:alpha-L-fucosidase [Spirochaetales bacterium]
MNNNDNRTERIPPLVRFKMDRFGVMIHFGLYSILGRGEWAMYNEAIPAGEYRKLFDKFLLSETFSPREWIRAAAAAGARYCILTTRHHEGFCLWDTATTDFNSRKSPCQRDLVKEFVDAANEFGLRVGLYYSLLDWSDQGYLKGPKADRSNWKEFVHKVHSQVYELMTHYGKIDVLWYDGFWPFDNPPYCDDITAEDWASAELNSMVRQLQPGILINDRSGIQEDFSTPEQEIVAKGRTWEACMSSNDNWGYHAGDKNWKTPRQVLGALVHSVSLGGNFLFNAGPSADGVIPKPTLDCLATIGEWIKENGASIYGCTKSFHLAREALDGGFFCNSGIWTFNPALKRLYYHILRWPGTVLRVRVQDIIVDHVSLLASQQNMPFSQKGNGLEVHGLPGEPIDDLDTVLAIDYHKIMY